MLECLATGEARTVHLFTWNAIERIRGKVYIVNVTHEGLAYNGCVERLNTTGTTEQLALLHPSHEISNTWDTGMTCTTHVAQVDEGSSSLIMTLAAVYYSHHRGSEWMWSRHWSIYIYQLTSVNAKREITVLSEISSDHLFFNNIISPPLATQFTLGSGNYYAIHSRVHFAQKIKI